MKLFSRQITAELKLYLKERHQLELNLALVSSFFSICTSLSPTHRGMNYMPMSIYIAIGCIVSYIYSYHNLMISADMFYFS
ncbi:MAG: hypothetical protein QW802_05040 [Candidatus Altiarchaeota archaeon]